MMTEDQRKVLCGALKQTAEGSLILGDAESLLDFLYWHYSEYNPIDNDVIKGQLEAMRSLLDLPSDLYDQVFGLVCDICLEHGRLGFVEGIRFGMVMMQ